MLNNLFCATPVINAYCGINFDLVFLWTVPFFLILVLNEILDKNTQWPREVHRKIAHVLSGVLMLLSSLYLSQIEILVFCIGLLVGSMIAKTIRFKSIYAVDRYTHGTVYFIVAVAVLAYLWVPDNLQLFQYGVLILTVPDALAAVIGSQWGRQIAGFNKSFLGSGVFFCTTVVVTLFFTQVWWVVVLVALILTIVEFFSQWGTDNLLLPLVGGFLLVLLL